MGRDTIQVAKGSKSPRCQNCQKVLDVTNPRAPPRDPKVQKIHDVQVSKSFPEKSTLSEAEFFLAVAFLVKGPLLEPMNPAL